MFMELADSPPKLLPRAGKACIQFSWKWVHPGEGNKKSQLLQMWVSYKGFQGAQTHLSRIETCSPS
jgi:hypothetical protein